MSIFTPVSSLTPVQKFVMNSASNVQNTFSMFSANLIRLYNDIWFNQDHVNLSPDKTWSALGTSAVQYRQAYLTAANYINTNHPGLMPLEPAGFTTTNNQDGSVTCVAAP